MALSAPQQQMLQQLTEELKTIDGVAAIVLGGSHATGMATERSDLDIGIYYYEAQPFNIPAIKSLATKYHTGSDPTVTDFYQWGPWVNGGAWLETAAGKVDFLYRNIDQVKATIAKAGQGEWENHYEQQPPYGFSSVIYLAETKACIPLYDPQHLITALKKSVSTYPPALRQTIIQQSLWAAEFTVAHAEAFAIQKDIYNLSGCLTRAVKNIISALFAINEIYPIGDKKAVEIIAQCKYSPELLPVKVEQILVITDMVQSTVRLKALLQEVIDLTDGAYKALYNFSK
ncbi:nucleotidyltransferase domain-containing protein [Chitinophaga nivalis]|uniref:Nucleotidyltransferase domain-containing protein n=1 Tax=Chitinophaga nivalis TaxID=2991709 RepID=A0ABT3IL14_9BACT|nr:nucleotidyltransferase domain-containing protein [Chitinophaga nivalis]MCW3465691.1 nucleotidyltransferase domain-containing protein [Chitinophaga nivalis]MCW3484618.1 nucleotidyltransferase domain-containing protein [Chitinophaga nivalis]